MKIPERFGSAIDGAACNILGAAGDAAINAGIGLAATGAGFKPGAVVAGAGALAHYALSIACPYDAGGESPTGGTFCGLNTGNICLEWEVGYGMIYQEYAGDFLPLGINYQLFSASTCPVGVSDEPDSEGYYSHRRTFTYVLIDGSTFTKEHVLYSPNQNPNAVRLESRQQPIDGVPSECTEKPRVEPVETVDGNNCEITVQMMGWGATPGGTIAPIMLTEPGHLKQQWEDEEMWKRENPGPISGYPGRPHNQTCSFAPFLSFPGPNGDPITTPIEPGDDFADALDRLSKQLDDQYQDISGELDDVNDKLDELLEKEDGEDPEDPISIPSGKIEFQAVCDKDAEGNLEKVTYPLSGATTRNEALVAIYQINTTLAGMIQQHLNWKTPICPPERPELKGDFVTIRFESEGKSPNGDRPLRKLFRYRSQSTRDLRQLTDYWKNFTFSAGAVCVYHKGSAVGTPQVWAASADEGKRVIRHAFGETGVDPDQVGQWGVSGSDNPRFGVSGSIKVKQLDRAVSVTSRKGSNGLPLVAVDP